jgi:hypothetical protein
MLTSALDRAIIRDTTRGQTTRMELPMTRRLASACLTTLFLTACNGDDTATSATDSDTTTGGETTGSTTDVDPTATTGTPSAGPTRYFLRIDDEPVPDVVLEMDKEKALEVFGEAAARDLVLIEVDSTPLLENALRAIQFSCGGAWENQNEDPKHDCSQTELGKSYGDNWQKTPEFALVRMLTMTPANAVVKGTSLEPMANTLANINDPDLKFSKVLADTLGISQASPFITLEVLVAALKKTLLASHPNVDNDVGLLKITLWDAANDMQPLSEVYGPVDGHPGILYPDSGGFTTTSNALTERFKMRVVAQSNLKWVDGIDLSVGGGDMFVTDADAILSFDFLDPEKLVIEGVFGQEAYIDGEKNPDWGKEPTLDMRFSIAEHGPAIAPCTDTPDCHDNFPTGWTDPEGNPLGAGPIGADTAWNLSPWLLEYIVGYSALLSYGYNPPLEYDKCLISYDDITCAAGIWIGEPSGAELLPPNNFPFDPGPSGWSIFKAFDVPVPDPQYLWELLIEVAEVAIHDTNGDKIVDIQPGDANPLFALKGVKIGLTAEEMIAQIRPKMQEQADKVANVILGKYWKNNGHLDFYYRRPAEGGTPYLYFVAESDLRPDKADPESLAAYTYANPGFFSCAELTEACKVSATSVDGLADTTHEKYRLPVGDSTLFAADDDGVAYQIDFFVPAGDNPTEIVATVNAL